MARAGIGDRVEGFHAVAAAVEAGRVRRLTVESKRLRHDDYAALVAGAEAGGAEVRRVGDVREEAASDAPQGVLADCVPIPTVDVDAAAAMADPSAVLVLDHLQDPRNLGAIARSAYAAGVPAIVIPERRAAPVGATAFKAAAGALEHVAVCPVGSVADAVERLRRRGLWAVGLDGDAEASLLGHHLLSEPVAVVVGAEGAGLGRLVAERCDTLVRIPMAGPMESLNASVAASLAVFELARVRGWIA